MKKLFSLLLALALCGAMVSGLAEDTAPADDAASLAGVWYLTGGSTPVATFRAVGSDPWTLTLADDGTFATTLPFLEAAGTWTQAGDAVTLSAADGYRSGTLQMTGGELVLDYHGTTYVFSRTAPEPMALPAAVPVESAAALNGTWIPSAAMTGGMYLSLDAVADEIPAFLHPRDGGDSQERPCRLLRLTGTAQHSPSCEYP